MWRCLPEQRCRLATSQREDSGSDSASATLQKLREPIVHEQVEWRHPAVGDRLEVPLQLVTGSSVAIRLGSTPSPPESIPERKIEDARGAFVLPPAPPRCWAFSIGPSLRWTFG